MKMTYTPPATLREFHNDPSFVRCVVGPLGSGKSTAMIMELLRRAQTQTPDSNGRRPTRFAIIRNTLQQLLQTVLPDIKLWLGPACNWHVSHKTVYVDYKLPDGTAVNSEWLLIPIDTVEDTRRLLSLNLTGAWVSEVREVPYEVFGAVQGRLGRYPRAQVAPTWEGLISETNPWSEGSPYHENFVLSHHDNWKMFHQPGGLDPKAENTENLPADYYVRLIDGKSEDWVNVHVHSMWGEDVSGKAVFGRSFKPIHHVSPQPLLVIPTRPLMVTHDFGRTPTALVNQIDPRGRLVTLKEVMAENMGLEEFVRGHLVPTLKDARFVGNRVYVVGDPTGQFKSTINEDSCFDVLRKARLTVVAAPTNDVPPRIRAVENLLARRDGALIDGPNCPNLVRALGYNYRYKRRKNGQLDPLPDKNHPWSDLGDCYEYAACSIDGSVEARAAAWDRMMSSIPGSGSAKMPVQAWT